MSLRSIGLSDFQKAYLDWSDLQPRRGEVCCTKPHRVQDKKTKKWQDLPDHLVCHRERAWRRYTRVRDSYLKKK